MDKLPTREAIARIMDNHAEYIGRNQARFGRDAVIAMISEALSCRAVEGREAIREHIQRYDTPKADDPRRRYTEAQLDMAMSLAQRDHAALATPTASPAIEQAVEALEWIDGEAPSNEPPATPTVGFPPSRDPELDDGNDVVLEAFEEGVRRGLWLAAEKARTALKNMEGLA